MKPISAVFFHIRTPISFLTFFVITVISLVSHGFNPLEYSNRSQCAIESTQPAHSTWMILDTYNAQKLAHNYALSTGQESKKWVSKASTEFRIGITHLTLQIINKLLNGELPLLPTDLNSNSGRLNQYKSIIKKCQNRLKCSELNTYLKTLWTASEIQNQEERIKKLTSLDNMTSSDFINRKKSTKSDMSCHLIKNFSALQGPIEKTKPIYTDFEQIAKAWLNQEQYITSCYSQDPDLNQDSSVLQFDIKTENLNWNLVGYDFWNTIKIMTSWAWRHTSTLNEMSRSFHHLFKSLVLEESMMLVPNGCRSITPPKCDAQTLSENSIRELAKLESSNQEHFSRIPEGPDKKVLKMTPPEVNADILDFNKSNSLDSWLLNFKKNLTSARGLSKNRLQNNLQTMDRIYRNLSLDQVKNHLNHLLAVSRQGDLEAKKSLHLICQESRMALDSRFNFFSRDLDYAFNSQLLEQLNQSAARDPKILYSYLMKMGEIMIPLCDQASNERLTEVLSEDIKRGDYRPWAQKLLDESQNIIENNQETIDVKKNGNGVLLWNPHAGFVQNNILCLDAIDCARTYIDSAVQIRAVIQYASAFKTHTGEMTSSSILNPYSELKACEIYDPWFQSKQSIRNLIRDTTNTALFGWNFFPVYLDLSSGVPQVSSLNQIFEDGILKFAPGLSRTQTQANLMVDFGPLAGVPCSISIANGSAGLSALQQMPYYLTGVTVNYCDSKGELQNQAIDALTVKSQPQVNTQKCVGCTIGLVSAESMVSYYNSKAIAPIKFSVQVFKTISNFISSRKDPVNIPRQAKVNPEYVARVYQQYNTIPEQCVDQLSQGLSCYQNLCAAQSAHEFERRTGFQVKNAGLVPRDLDSSSSHSGEYYAYVETDLCKGEIRFSVNCRNENKPDFDFRNLMSFEKSCQKKLKSLQQEMSP